jgi:hypothetical protein
MKKFLQWCAAVGCALGFVMLVSALGWAGARWPIVFPLLGAAGVFVGVVMAIKSEFFP